jgi:hypothetical protein
MIAPGGRWDYKVHGGNEPQGNFNFRATGSILFSDYALGNGAGFAQKYLGDSSKSEGILFIKAPYGDQPSDVPDVTAGIDGGCG